VHSAFFEGLCAFVIILNSAFAWWVADYGLEHVGEGLPRYMSWMSISFLIFYSIELFLKIAVHRFYFFANDDMYWNLFDFALVAFTVYDEVVSAIIGQGSGTSLTFMRTLRILKMAKILRVIRVMRYFTELRLILNSLMGSFMSLFWSIVTLLLIFYIFSLCFVQGVSTYLADEKAKGNGQLGSTICGDDITESFGTVGDTMLTLYKTCTGGDDWSRFFNELREAGWPYAYLFVFFVAFIQIALFNILTAIFVENAMKLAQPDRDAMALQVRKNEVHERKELLQLVKDLDINQDGVLDKEEFSKHLQHGKLKAYLAVLGLDIAEAETFLKVLTEAAQDAPVGIEDFVDGCLRMKGSASSLDMQTLLFETKIVRRRLDAMSGDCQQQFRLLNLRNSDAIHRQPSGGSRSSTPNGASDVFLKL
jgi:hypothetical protein